MSNATVKRGQLLTDTAQDQPAVAGWAGALQRGPRVVPKQTSKKVAS
jgi:hypothetical protein